MTVQDDAQTAAGLELWYASTLGRCLVQAQEELVVAHLSHWPKAGRTLLDVNCGLGQLQQPLRYMGLDVTGCEPSPALRERFVKNLGSRFVIDPGHADLLPHADGSFDWVLLHLERGTDPNLAAATLKEARRVAQLGMAVLLWNRCSLACLLDFRRRVPLTPLSAAVILRVMKGWREGKAVLYGRLFGPAWLWHEHGCAPVRRQRRGMAGAILSRCAPERLAAPVASVCLVRLDLPPSRPMTATPIKFSGFKFANQGLVEGCSDRSFPGDV